MDELLLLKLNQQKKLAELEKKLVELESRLQALEANKQDGYITNITINTKEK